MPGYKANPFKYDSRKFAEQLTGKSQKQIERMRDNLETLALYPFVSALLLDEKVSINKLKADPRKFRSTCEIIESNHEKDVADDIL